MARTARSRPERTDRARERPEGASGLFAYGPRPGSIVYLTTTEAAHPGSGTCMLALTDPIGDTFVYAGIRHSKAEGGLRGPLNHQALRTRQVGAQVRGGPSDILTNGPQQVPGLHCQNEDKPGQHPQLYLQKR